MSSESPPTSVRAACRFPLRDALAYDGVCKLAEISGWWRHPAIASGDLEDMSFLDKAYWLYKSSHPVAVPLRDSGLDTYFAMQEGPGSLPEGFSPETTVRISAVGDLMSHVYLPRSRDTLYRDVVDSIFAADLVLGNFEGVAQSSSKQIDIAGLDTAPVLGIAPAVLDVLISGPNRPYDFLATASNHSLDFGEAGIASTIAALRERGVAFHGINEHEEDANRASVLERCGVRFAVVSHTFGTNACRAPSHRPRIVNHTKLNRALPDIDLSLLRTQLANAVAAKADFVIAQLHWGMEFEYYPRPAQVEVAHELAEIGVDLIIGHHPHVCQPVDYYRTRRDPDRIVPTYYSLGNLTTPFAVDFMSRSGVAQLQLSRGIARDGVRRTYVRAANIEMVEQIADPVTRTLCLRPCM